MSEDNHFEIITRCLRRVRNGLSCFAAGCLAGTVVFTGVGLLEDKPSSFTMGTGGAFAAATLITGSLALKNSRITSSEIYKTIKDSPYKIAWVYPGGISHKINGIQASKENVINIHLNNGHCLQLRSITAQEVQLIISLIKQQAPQAVYGYSETARLNYLHSIG